MHDNVLGQQQDDIARLRCELSKLAGADDTLAGCQSAFDVFRRLIEQGKRNLVSTQLSDSLRALNTDFDAKPWVDKLLAWAAIGNIYAEAGRVLRSPVRSTTRAMR